MRLGRDAREEFVDEKILRTPQGHRVEPGGAHERGGVDPPEWGELKTSGAVWPSGSETSKGGSNSSAMAHETSRRDNLSSRILSVPVAVAPVHVDQAVTLSRLFYSHACIRLRGLEFIMVPKRLSRPEILLAEDDNDMRRFLVKALQNAGYQVASFDNGLSAYNRLREEPFELLLTDIVMPEMDGIELARKATELDPDIKVMFITGFAAVALNPDSKAPKDAKVLSKPFHLRDLVNEVEKMMAA